MKLSFGHMGNVYFVVEVFCSMAFVSSLIYF